MKTTELIQILLIIVGLSVNNVNRWLFLSRCLGVLVSNVIFWKYLFPIRRFRFCFCGLNWFFNSFLVISYILLFQIFGAKVPCGIYLFIFLYLYIYKTKNVFIKYFVNHGIIITIRFMLMDTQEEIRKPTIFWFYSGIRELDFMYRNYCLMFLWDLMYAKRSFYLNRHIWKLYMLLPLGLWGYKFRGNLKMLCGMTLIFLFLWFLNLTSWLYYLIIIILFWVGIIKNDQGPVEWIYYIYPYFFLY